MKIFRLVLGVALGYAAVVVTVMLLTALVSLVLGPRFLDAGPTSAWSFGQVAVVLIVAVLSAWCGGFAAAWWGGGRVSGYLLAVLLLLVGAIAILAGGASGATTAPPLWLAALALFLGAASAVVGTHSPRAAHARAAARETAQVGSP